MDERDENDRYDGIWESFCVGKMEWDQKGENGWSVYGFFLVFSPEFLVFQSWVSLYCSGRREMERVFV